MTPEEQDDDRGERTMFVTREHLLNAMSVADPLAHYLVVLEGTSPGKRLEIGAEPITIGRGAQQTLVCDDREVSRLHARVALVNGAVVAEDLSTNGTFVDGERITGAVTLKEGATIRLGGQTIKYERRSRLDVKKAQELERDIRKASDYVLSLLPAPVASGPVRAEWCFVPSAQLGGDAFGYYWLDPGTFVFYLVDVSGHGVGSAMHSVSVLNVLRQRALPLVDFTNPPEVLASLNDQVPDERTQRAVLHDVVRRVSHRGTRALLRHGRSRSRHPRAVRQARDAAARHVGPDDRHAARPDVRGAAHDRAARQHLVSVQ